MTANEMKFASEIDQALNFYKTFLGERVLYDRGPSDFLPHVEQRRLLAFTGLASEAGEASDAFKKYFFHGKPLNEMRDKIILELGDVFWSVPPGYIIKAIAKAITEIINPYIKNV